MIATVVFVLAFLVVGLLVVLVALSGGPKHMRSSLQGESRGARRFLNWTVLVLVVAFVVAIPVAIAADNGDTASKRGPEGLDLTAAQASGRSLFARNCATCHTLAAANAVGKVGPNLDVLRPPKALVVNAVQQGRARGMGQMPAQLLQGRDLQNVADFVAAVAGRSGS
jgi:mono/diheme cytochrome c family protein